MDTTDRDSEGSPTPLSEALDAAKRAHPHQRVCQIIVNATGRSDPFYVTDDDLVRALREYAASWPDSA